MTSKRTQWQIAVAAEAIAAAQFARAGCDVSVQYGANQPEYDLVAARGQRIMKVSVKGSQDGGWGLTQSFILNADYHGAIDAWLARHGAKTVLCFVQFREVGYDELPRLYLARPSEVAARLKDSAAGRGETILYEHHQWTLRAHAAGTIDRIPDSWRFTEERVDSLLDSA